MKPPTHTLLTLGLGIFLAQCGQTSNAGPRVPAPAPTDTDAASFQRTVHSGTETLDALSRLFQAINQRRSAEAKAMEAPLSPFADVSKTDSAYQEVLELYVHGALLGYPDGFFSGRRILTRYEFAVAVKRALDRLPPGRSEAPAMPVSREDLRILSRLVMKFDPELRAFGMNLREVRTLLDTKLNGSRSGGN